MTRSHTAPAAAPTRQVGDTITIGAVRWVIRSIQGDAVTLEAANVQPGITWHTTLDNLPEQKDDR